MEQISPQPCRGLVFIKAPSSTLDEFGTNATNPKHLGLAIDPFGFSNHIDLTMPVT